MLGDTVIKDELNRVILTKTKENGEPLAGCVFGVGAGGVAACVFGVGSDGVGENFEDLNTASIRSAIRSLKFFILIKTSPILFRHGRPYKIKLGLCP